MFNKKKGLFIGLSIGLIGLAGCSSESAKDKTDENKNKLKDVTLVLDYIPNTNHTGIYVAKDKGYYKEQGIDLTIVEPGDDNTSLTLLGGKKGEFAISYQEDLTYSAASAQPIPTKAIAAIMEHNTSGFVSTADKKISSPKDFEGKTYAGWQSAGEEAVLKAVMEKDNADSSKVMIVGDPGGGPSDLEKNVDLKWYFEGWDLTKAKMDGYDLNYMPLRELDERLDYYTPIIVARDDVMENDPTLVEHFLKATKHGYLDAIDNPEESAEILHQAAPDQDIEFLKKSQEFVSKNYTSDPQKWGIMKEDVWNNYTEFMLENKLIDKDIPASDMFTNVFIEKVD